MLGERSLYEAIEGFQRAITASPNVALILNDSGYAYFLAGQYIQAVTAYQDAIRLQPDYALAHSNLGTAYII